MATTYPSVMRSANTDVDQYPDHANVLAVVATYQVEYGAMPWRVLVDVMGSLPSINSDLALGGAGRHVEAALVDIVADLRALGFIELTGEGTVRTERGESYIKEWNGKFERRKDQARAALARLRFPRFTEQ